MLELTLGRFIKEDKAEIDITIDNAYQLTKQLFPSRTNNKYFYNCSKGKKEFNISIKDIVVSEDLGNEIIDTIYKTHDLIPDIPTSDPDEEQTYGVKVKGAIEAVVISLANKYHYENRGIFTFISELLIRITNVHAFHNGNKRTAIVSISRILETFGYYLIWSQSSKAYILYWEKFMLGIAKYREKDANQYDYEGLVASVKDVLLKSMRINAKKIK